MAVNQAMVDAAIRHLSRAQVMELERQALTDSFSGVEVTNVNLEGGSASGTSIRMKPVEALEFTDAVLRQMDDPTRAGRADSAAVRLNQTFST